MESELHFLFHCDKHSLLRIDLIQKLHTICPIDSNDIEKIKYILTHAQLISKTGQFIIDALKKSQLNIYLFFSTSNICSCMCSIMCFHDKSYLIKKYIYFLCLYNFFLFSSFLYNSD